MIKTLFPKVTIDITLDIRNKNYLSEIVHFLKYYATITVKDVNYFNNKKGKNIQINITKSVQLS